MKYFEILSAFFKKYSNYFVMLLAVSCALGMWWAVSKTNQVEAQLEVALDYTGIPDELVVTDGLLNKMTVRVRAPERLLRSLTQNSIHQGINLSSIKKGSNIVPFDRKQLTDPVLRAFDVIDINPPRLELKADTLISKRVPISLNPIEPVDSMVTAEGLTPEPSTVTLKGPESEIAKYTFITVNVPIEFKRDKKEDEKYKVAVNLDTPNFVTVDPPQIEVTYRLTASLVNLVLKCPVYISDTSDQAYELEPRELTVEVEVPESLARDKVYLETLKAFVTPPFMKAGETRVVKPRFQRPDGMIIPGAARFSILVKCLPPPESNEIEQDKKE